MFHMKVRGGKAFATEQKIREFKKIILRSKRFEKLKKKQDKTKLFDQRSSTKYERDYFS